VSNESLAQLLREFFARNAFAANVPWPERNCVKEGSCVAGSGKRERMMAKVSRPFSGTGGILWALCEKKGKVLSVFEFGLGAARDWKRAIPRPPNGA
jgi:hypothetical protein